MGNYALFCLNSQIIVVTLTCYGVESTKQYFVQLQVVILDIFLNIIFKPTYIYEARYREEKNEN